MRVSGAMTIRLGNSSFPIRTGVKSGCSRAVEISFSMGIAPFGSLSRQVAACLGRRLRHQVIELGHKRALVWSGIVTERLGAFHQNLVRVVDLHYAGVVDH